MIIRLQLCTEIQLHFGFMVFGFENIDFFICVV